MGMFEYFDISGTDTHIACPESEGRSDRITGFSEEAVICFMDDFRDVEITCVFVDDGDTHIAWRADDVCNHIVIADFSDLRPENISTISGKVLYKCLTD